MSVVEARMNNAGVAISANPRKSSTYLLLDAFRGFAAVWVVMGHCCNATILTTYPNLLQFPLYRFSELCLLGVVMFFVISGYCITAAMMNAASKSNPVRSFLVARIRRIFPPYYFSTFVVVLMSLLIAFLSAHRIIPEPHHMFRPWEPQSFAFYVSALTLTQIPLHVSPIIDVYWSLSYEVAFYAITALLYAAFKERMLVAFNGLTVLSLVWLIVSPNTVPFPLTLWYLFGLGGMAYALTTSIKKDWATIAFFTASLLLAAICAVIHPGVSRSGHPSNLVQMLFGVVFSVAVVAIYRHDKLISEFAPVVWLRNVGFFSYSLYLAHTMILWIPWQVTKHLGLAKGLCLVPFFAQVITAIACGYVFFLFCEKPFLSSRAKQRETTVSA